MPLRFCGFCDYKTECLRGTAIAGSPASLGFVFAGISVTANRQRTHATRKLRKNDRDIQGYNNKNSENWCSDGRLFPNTILPFRRSTAERKPHPKEALFEGGHRWANFVPLLRQFVF